MPPVTISEDVSSGWWDADLGGGDVGVGERPSNPQVHNAIGNGLGCGPDVVFSSEMHDIMDVEAHHESSSDIMSSLGIENLVPNQNAALGEAPLAADIAYFYLRDTLELQDGEMWDLMSTGSSLLGLTAGNLKEKVNLLGTRIGVIGGDLGKLVVKQPSLLMISAENLKGKLDFFEGMVASGGTILKQHTEDVKGMVMSHPCLLCYSDASLKDKVDNLVDRLELTSKELSKLVVDCPQLLTMSPSSDGQLSLKLDFFLDTLQIPASSLKKIVLSWPKTLLYSLSSLESTLIPFYVGSLRLTPPQLSSLLTRNPRILSYSHPDHVLPLYYTAQSAAGLTTTELSAAIRRYPKLCSHGVDRIVGCLGYLRSLGCDVRRVFTAAPQVVGLSLIRVRGRVDLIEGSGVKNEDVPGVINGAPNLLLLSDDNLRAKLSLLGSHGDAADMIRRNPSLLCYGIDRLRGRLEALRAAGLEAKRIGSIISFREDKWNGWIEAKRTGLRKKDVH